MARLTVHRAEHGHSVPSTAHALALARVLGIAAERLFSPVTAGDDSLQESHPAPDADQLAAALMSTNMQLVLLEFPSVGVAADHGLSASEHARWRSDWMLAVSEAVAILEVDGWDLAVETRESQSESVEFVLAIAAVDVPTDVNDDQDDAA